MARKGHAIKAKVLPCGNIRFYMDDERKSGVSELQITNPDGITGTVTTIGGGRKVLVIEKEKIMKYTERRLSGPDERWFREERTFEDGTVKTLRKRYRIRKLTPKECMRLMGVSDEDTAKMKASGISDSQMYKLAGNSIVVPVLEAIFSKMFEI